jgi:hypothetical protein
VFESTKVTEELSGYVVNNDIEGIRRMVDAGVDINAQIREGRAALHLAVTSAKVEVVEAVLALGADVDLQFPATKVGDAPAFSALHHAAASQSLVKMELLLAAGANPNVRSTFGASPLHELLQDSAIGPACSNWIRCLQALLEAGADPNAEITKLLRLQRALQFERLFGAEASNALVMTTLHCAVLISHLIDENIAVAARLQGFHGARAIELLLQHGADPCFMPSNAPKRYLTPLQMAVKVGSAEDVQMMMESGRADMLQKTVAGRSLRQLTGRPEIHAILRSDSSASLVVDAVGRAGLPAFNGAIQASPRSNCSPI